MLPLLVTPDTFTSLPACYKNTGGMNIVCTIGKDHGDPPIQYLTATN